MTTTTRRAAGTDPRVVTVVGGVVGLAAGLAVWQAAAGAQPVLLATPGEAFAALRDLAQSGQLGRALLDTGRTLGAGLVVAIAVGIPGGLLLARSLLVERASLWLVFAVQAVPLVALAPLVSATVGAGFGAKVLIVFLAAVFPVLLNTTEGARRVPQALLDVGHVYRSRELTTWKDIVLPFTVPYVMTGVRQAIATAFIGTLVAEFFLSVSGVGALLLGASARFDIASVLGVTILLAVIAVALIGLGRVLEKAVAPWRR